MRILKNEDAASVSFGVILTVAITVTLAAITAMYIFDFGEAEVKGPTAGILVMDFPETEGKNDIKIIHAGGDIIKAGDWKLSIVQAGKSPVFQFSDTDFSVGDQILTTNVTDGNGTYTITNSDVYTNGMADTLKLGTKYNVQIIIYPFRTIAVDTDIILK